MHDHSKSQIKYIMVKLHYVAVFDGISITHTLLAFLTHLTNVVAIKEPHFAIELIIKHRAITYVVSSPVAK